MVDINALKQALEAQGVAPSEDVLAKVGKVIEQEQKAAERKAIEDATANASGIIKAALGKLIAQKDVADALGELASIVGEDKAFGVSIPYKDTKSFVTRTGASVASTRTGGGGRGGKTKDDYGMTLTEVFEAFATDEEREKLAAAKDSEDAGNKTYNVKAAVKARAIKDGLLTPK